MLSPHGASQVGADALLSHLVMGFIERRVAPQTIADVVLSQLVDDSEAAEKLKPSTWNGIVEACVSAPSVGGVFDIVMQAARRPDFPLFLSATATLGGLAAILSQPMELLERIQVEQGPSVLAIEALARKAADLLVRESQHESRAVRMRLINALKSTPAVVTGLSLSCPSLLIVRQLLLRLPSRAPETNTTAGFPSIAALLAAISKTPDHVLVHHTASDYAVGRDGSLPLQRPQASDDLCDAIANPGQPMSPFQVSFAVEWLLLGSLKAALGHAQKSMVLAQALRDLFAKTGPRLDVLKGVVRAFQKDLSLSMAGAAGGGHDPKPLVSGPGPGLHGRMSLATEAGAIFFGALSSCASNLWQNLAADFVPWALQLPCHPPESRLVTREQLEWLRVLDQKEWLEGLGAPPSWVVLEASRTAADVFQLAPGQWLQYYAAAFLDVLHRECLGSDFVLAKVHFDFVEFLIRTVRKKAPIFASEVDTLVALQILGRAHESEQNQIKLAVARLRLVTAQPGRDRESAQATLMLLTDPQAVERLGPHPLARALSLFARTAHRCGAKGKRDLDRRQFLTS